MPVRLGTDAEFAALRRALENAGYTEQAVCERLGLERLSAFELEGSTHQQREPEDALGLLIWLMMEGSSLAEPAAQKLPLGELNALGLIKPHLADPHRISATAMLYPVEGMWIASDRTRPVDGEFAPPPQDFVYPAITGNTEKYLAMIPFKPYDAFLDLCSGSGIAGLLAARAGARQVWAFDITERSTQFAEFNRRLNTIPNFTPARGDLYEPAGDLTFDCIVAHAPYVPVFRQNMVFDSGGHDGEQIVRGVIQGLPRHLRPGGRFYAPLVGTDRDQPFEMRLREWLGDAESDFDIAFFTNLSLAPGAYVAEAVTRNRATAAEAKPWRELLEKLGVKTIERGFLMMQRRDRPRRVFTVRREFGARSAAAEQHWIMDFETTAASDPQALLAERPRASASARLRVEHSFQQQSWTPDVFELRIGYPFELHLPAQAWTAHLLSRADGSHTAAELLEQLKSDGALHPQTPPLEFARVVAQLVSGGFLEMPGFKLPAAE